MYCLRRFFLFTLWCSVALGEAAAVAPPTITTITGALRGVTQQGITSYLGIPYAEPPVGNLRWRHAVPKARWSGVRDATKIAKACPQPSLQPTSEDCLYLNIWAPAGAKNLPIVFHIHPGFNSMGSGENFLTVDLKGARFAKQTGNIVVTFNFRLGALGQMAHPALDSLSETGISGNYGTSDQLLALKWVSDNAASFGGDPTKITIQGLSSGSVGACHLLTSPRAAGYFRAAILQSTSCNSYSRDYAEAVASAVIKKACGTSSPTNCLRTIAADKLIQAQLLTPNEMPPGSTMDQLIMPFFPVVDGDYVKESSRAAILAGRYNNVPIVMGTTSAELPPSLFSTVTTEAQFRSLVPTLIPQMDVDLAVTTFGTGGNWPQAASDIASHYFFTCSMLSLAKTVVRQQSAPVYHYVFDAAGKNHAADLPYYWKTATGSGESWLEVELAKSYGNFLQTLAPKSSQVVWPALQVESAKTTVIQEALMTVETNRSANKCAQLPSRY